MDQGSGTKSPRTSPDSLADKVGWPESDTRMKGNITVALPADYVKDFQHLKEKSDRGTLNSRDAIYKKLDEKARNLPELRRALNELKVNYV